MTSALEIIRWDGEKIGKPGCYRGIPMDAYHGDLCVGPSISSSGLRTIFSKSPKHYFKTSYLNPKRVEEPDKEAYIFGRAAHHLLLGEAEFDRHFVVRPDQILDKGKMEAWNGNRTACREWLAEQKAARFTVLTKSDIEAIRGMARELREEPLVRAGILDGLVEHSLIYLDRETGIWVKARPDVIPTDDMDIADLKAVADATDDSVEKSIGEYGYNVQGAVVAEACRQVFAREISSFSLVCCEKAEPHAINTKTLKPEDLDLGARQASVALRLFARSIETGHWDGPAGLQTDASYAELKPFHRTRIEHRLAVLEQSLAA